jgi:hypothetical protein
VNVCNLLHFDGFNQNRLLRSNERKFFPLIYRHHSTDKESGNINPILPILFSIFIDGNRKGVKWFKKYFKNTISINKIT